MNFFKYAAPQSFYPLAGKLVPLCYGLAAALAVFGVYLGFFVAPSDAVQGEVYRIIFIHVPSAWMSMWLYLIMAGYCALGLIFNTRLSMLLARAIAPTGAIMSFIALVTGAIWGKPTWGTWWIWDARLTSELLLLFLYLGYMALAQAIEDTRRADKISAVLALVGAINVPVIYFSVVWWNTLHQTASIRPSGSSMATPMLMAMLVMSLAAWAYCFGTIFQRVRTLIIERESNTRWVQILIDRR